MLGHGEAVPLAQNECTMVITLELPASYSSQMGVGGTMQGIEGSPSAKCGFHQTSPKPKRGLCTGIHILYTVFRHYAAYIKVGNYLELLSANSWIVSMKYEDLLHMLNSIIE